MSITRSGEAVDLRQLECFVHVAELGSFTRAANFLSVAQPVLSRQVRALEVELRQTLFERNGRGVTVTEPGKRLLEHGRGILAQVERARLSMEEDRGAATGQVVVALPPSVSNTLTAPLLRAFREHFPKATLCVLEGLSAYLLEWLTIGRADCAVVYTVATSSAFDLVPVLNEQLYLVSARGANAHGNDPLVGDPVNMAEVAQRQVVIPRRPHSIRMLLEAAMAQSSLKPRIALEIESIPAILNLVHHDDMHAVLSLNAIRSSGHESDFLLRPIKQLETTLWIATSTQRPRGPLLAQTTQLLARQLREIWGANQVADGRGRDPYSTSPS